MRAADRTESSPAVSDRLDHLILSQKFSRSYAIRLEVLQRRISHSPTTPTPFTHDTTASS